MGDPGGKAPQKVGLYELQEPLQQRPEGTLYKAFQAGLNRTVALWLIAPELANDEAYRQRFLDQAKRAPKLNTENAARLLDVGQCSQTQRWFAVTEFVDGGLPLPTLIERRGGKLERAEALEVCAALCDALTAGTELGLVHGDIRLENVVFDSGRTAKLLHLGLAKHGPRAEARAYSPTRRQDLRESFDLQDDLYSVGVCLSLMVTGKTAETFDPATAAEGLDDHLASLVLTLIADDRANRFPTAAEAAEVARSVLTMPVIKAPPKKKAWTEPVVPDIEATVFTEATMRKMTPKPESRSSISDRVRRTSSGRIQKGSGEFAAPSSRAKTPEKPAPAQPHQPPPARPTPSPSQEVRTPSGRIQRGSGYYGAPGSGEGLIAEVSKPTVPQLSLDDPKDFLRGWEIHVKGKTGGEVSPELAALRRNHYFHKITNTMEKVPASFLLTMGPGQNASSDEAKAPRMLLSDDMSRAYKIERKLGQGGQGTVYKATVEGGQTFDGYSKPVTTAAVKVSHDADALLSEQAIYSIPNPGIIKLLDAGQIAGSKKSTSYLVLERLYPHPFQLFSPSEDERSPVDLATAVDTFVNILLTVHELHYRKKLPLVLCDIKPDNMMVRMSGEGGTPSLKEYLRRLAAGAYEPVLLDMGCAQHHGELRKARGRMNVIIGTPLYMSPEVAPRIVDGKYVAGFYNAKQDVYSLTLTFYYLLTGVRPYTNSGLYKVEPDNLFNELLSFKQDEVDPIDYDLLERRVGREHMSDFVEILQKGLHPDPDYRATAKVLFKLCEKKFRVKEVRLREMSKYYYDDIKGLCLAQDVFPRIRPDYNLYLNPEDPELRGPPRQRSRRVSRSEMGLPRGGTSQQRRPPSETGRTPRPVSGRHERPASDRQTGRFRRDSGSWKRPGDA